MTLGRTSLNVASACRHNSLRGLFDCCDSDVNSMGELCRRMSSVRLRVWCNVHIRWSYKSGYLESYYVDLRWHNFGHLVQRETPHISVEEGGWGNFSSFNQHVAVSQKRWDLWPRLSLITNRKSHKAFQWSQKLSTLDNLEGLLRTLLWQSCIFLSTPRESETR